MKISTKYVIALVSAFILFLGITAIMDGQTVTRIDKAVKSRDLMKARLLNYNEIYYTADISTWYNQAGNCTRRGVYLRFYNGDWSKPESWLVDLLKLYFNGVEVTNKNEPNYWFDSSVTSLTSNLNVVIKTKTDNYSSDLFSATGTDTPVSMIFPTEGYVYKIPKKRKGPITNQLNTLPVRKAGLKVAWTPTTDTIKVWLLGNNGHIKQLVPAPGKTAVWFESSLFKAGGDYTIRLHQFGPHLTLSGKFKSGSYVRRDYTIECDIKTK